METSPRVAGVFESVPLGDLVRTAKLTLNVVPCDGTPEPCTSVPPEAEPAEALLDELGIKDCSGHGVPLATTVVHSDGKQEKAPANDHTTLKSFWMGSGELRDPSLADMFGTCGPLGGALVVCPSPNPSPLEEAAYYLLSAVFAEDVPLDAPKDHLQYGFVFDQDGDAGNNYRAPSSYPADFFDATDRWDEVVYTPSAGFELRVSDATDGIITRVPSNARVRIEKNVISSLRPTTGTASSNRRSPKTCTSCTPGGSPLRAAEEEGFEPTVALRLRRFSRPLP